MRGDERDYQQGREVHRHDAIPGQVFFRSIRSVNRRHVMGRVDKYTEGVKTQCEGLTARGKEISHQDKEQ